MASKSAIAADRRRRATVARYSSRRAALRDLARTATTHDERLAAYAALSKLPRDASPSRLRSRDATDGRPRGYLRKAGISRIRFRELAHLGHLPGVTKSSW
ncbi:30S ribosomal protein S14 [Micropruina sp.]|uniref:30S ribosomal protein S14 n=1 Tax=Micropruina sp. TaxID=2737536 RepID=UPI0039E535E2